MTEPEAEYRARYSADLPQPNLVSAPGHSPVARVADLVLVASDSRVDTSDLGAHPPILMPEFPDGPAGQARDPDPIALGRDVELLRLAASEAERIMNACSPRGHYFFPIRQYGQRYTFRRPVPAADWQQHLYRWDGDGTLREVLQVSRLVLDNAWSTEYAARVIEHENGEQQIVWIGEGAPLYRLGAGRDWLTASEAADLAGLLGAYWQVSGDLPARVKRAAWNAEYLCSVRWLDVRLPLLVIAFEGLINTAQSLASRQFRERVPLLAAEAGADGITSDICKRFYAARSRWAHGSHIALRSITERQPDADPEAAQADVDPAVIEDIALFQSALRRVVRRCIEDPEFAAVFADSGRIRERWPVRV